MNKLTYICTITSLMLTGCAASNGISQSTENNYLCKGSGSFFDIVGTGGREALDKCKEQAQTYCSSRDSKTQFIDGWSQNATPVSVASTEVTFSCLSDMDIAQIEKAKQEKLDTKFADFLEIAKNKCEKAFGFKPDTPEMSNCLLSMHQQQETDDKASESTNKIKESIDELVRQQQMAQDAANREAALNKINEVNKALTPKTITCDSYGSTTTCR